MKILVIYFILIISCISCIHHDQVKKEEVQNLYTKGNMQILLDSFLRENKSPGDIYEIYIDKIDPNNCNIYLYSGKKSLTENENSYERQVPLSYTIIQGVKFDIYSGVERYFSYVPDTTVGERHRVGINSIGEGWFISDSSGIFTIQKEKINIYPFLPYIVLGRYSPIDWIY